MYTYSHDLETGGLILEDSLSEFSKEPRPVWAKELDLLGFDKFWKYDSNGPDPYLWAEANFYWYRGKKVAKTNGGSLYEKPEIELLKDETGKEVLPEGSSLLPVDIAAMVAKNRRRLEALETLTVKKIYDIYRKYEKKLDLGYEYTAGIESSYKEDGLPLDEMSHSELFDYFTAGGDAFPEQAWSWAGEYEWINNDGTIHYLDECGNIKDGTADELEDTFNTAIRRYINEHYSKLMVADDYKLRVVHNFVGNKFKWLYAKYAYGCNPNHHCTNAIRGRYSKKFSRNNPDFAPGSTIILDEFPTDSWDAIYICGVSSSGYTKHQNYIHNVHIALIPAPGRRDHWEFENWVMDLENGYFEYVPSEKEIPAKYLSLPEQFWTCRMFRWAVWHNRKQIGDC